MSADGERRAMLRAVASSLDALATMAPEQADRIVFMTGGAFTKQAAEFFTRVGNPTIEKPFDRAGLFAVIDGLLG